MNTTTTQEELAVITYELRQINAEIAKLSKLLTGNGNPESGLVVRMDRIEQNERQRGWIAKPHWGQQ